MEALHRWIVKQRWFRHWHNHCKSFDNFKITSTIRFKFKASNNEAKYETLLAGLRLAHFMKVDRIIIFGDSQQVVNRTTEEYLVRGEKMSAYL